MGFQPRPLGISAVSAANQHGWTVGTILGSAKSWTTLREVVAIESWGLRLKTLPNGETTVYKALPPDVQELEGQAWTTPANPETPTAKDPSPKPPARAVTRVRRVTSS